MPDMYIPFKYNAWVGVYLDKSGLVYINVFNTSISDLEKYSAPVAFKFSANVFASMVAEIAKLIEPPKVRKKFLVDMTVALSLLKEWACAAIRVG